MSHTAADLTPTEALKLPPGKGVIMKVNEMKLELEKVSKVIPELRKELDEIYHMETGKKGRMKLLWKEFEPRINEIRNSREYRDILQ